MQISDNMKEEFGKSLELSHLMWENDEPLAFLPEWHIWKKGYLAGRALNIPPVFYGLKEWQSTYPEQGYLLDKDEIKSIVEFVCL